VMSKIRDPFFTTKEVGKGTGLGLSIVDQIITSHGGELLIESEADKGTTVTVVLPVIATAPIEETEVAEGDDQGADGSAANDPEMDDASVLTETAGTEDDVPEVASV